jgi:hypothetical protein
MLVGIREGTLERSNANRWVSSVKVVVRGVFLALVVTGPLVVGVPLHAGQGVPALLLGASLGFLLGVLWMLSGSSSVWARRVVLVVVSCFLVVVLADLVARRFVSESNTASASVDWPPMPLVQRFGPNVRFTGTIYGEAAAPSSMAAYREYRAFRFYTDRFGFRNEGVPQGPLDVIALGDSFGAGAATTQEQTWSVMLGKWFGLRVYNLAVGGSGPWGHYANLALEADRLKTKPQGTVVVWMLFPGTDLEVPCYPIFDKDQLPWRSGLGRIVDSVRAFRASSPLGQALVSRAISEAPANVGRASKFLDGTHILFKDEYAREASIAADGVRRHPNFDCIKRTVSAMRHFAAVKGLTVAAVVVPSKDEVYSWVRLGDRPWSTPSTPSGFASAIREVARANDMPFLDLKPSLLEASQRVFRESGRLIYWRDDSHWNAEGNLEVAKILYNFYTSLPALLAQTGR